MPTLRGNLSKFVEEATPFLDEVVGGDFTSWPAIGGQFLNQKSMASGWKDIGTRSTLSPFGIKNEIGEHPEDKYLIGPQMRIAAVEYAKRVPTSRIAIEDARTFPEAASILAGVGKDIQDAATLTKELLAHDILNANTHKTPDGVVLFSAAHKNLQNDTYGNTAAGVALTEANLEAAVFDLKNMTNDVGAPINQIPAKLIVPLALEWTAMKILGTTSKVGSNFNDINVTAGLGLQLVVSPYLTSDVTWFVQAQSHKLNWYNREQYHSWTNTDDNKGLVEQGASFRAAIGAADPRGIIRYVG